MELSIIQRKGLTDQLNYFYSAVPTWLDDQPGQLQPRLRRTVRRIAIVLQYGSGWTLTSILPTSKTDTAANSILAGMARRYFHNI